MSRPAHLPPRPFQRKASPRSYQDPMSPSSNSNASVRIPRHQRCPSQSAIPEESPAWLEDLLDDPDSNYKGIVHRRSASDSLALLDGVAESLPAINTQISEKNREGSQGKGKLDFDCTYGPNSPRQKANSVSSESSIVSALEEYISDTNLQSLDSSHCILGMENADFKDNFSMQVGDLDGETRSSKRHSGQRSRIRRLQYIASLEKTLKAFEAFQSELVAAAGNLLQQRADLTIENTYLKQQIVQLQKEKLLLEGKHQSLRREAENLKLVLARTSNAKPMSFEAIPASLEATWKSLGLEKLCLN
ncbi:hypothetical protein MLD38_003781 [Melastoma candidum]|uniref:Uncharacterized protein n=1 Tax=Melastoma candidum TaxID=119954 RepID=A0ACB9S507_9MYRT|nr:hypothetical protein MLD38_003781 [Melastoma candidum]